VLTAKKGILRDKRDFWMVLQQVEKYASDAVDITTSVREMPHIKCVAFSDLTFNVYAVVRNMYSNTQLLDLETRFACSFARCRCVTACVGIVVWLATATATAALLL